MMEGDQGTGAPSDEPQADSAAASDSFSQLWTDVMGMLVSFAFGVGGRGARAIIDWHHRLSQLNERSSKVTLDLPGWVIS